MRPRTLLRNTERIHSSQFYFYTARRRGVSTQPMELPLIHCEISKNKPHSYKEFNRSATRSLGTGLSLRAKRRIAWSDSSKEDLLRMMPHIFCRPDR